MSTAPDGRWCWIVTFSSFMHNFLIDGVAFSFGIFFMEFLEYFGSSKGKTQFLSSVISGSYLSIGPLVSIAINRFGCRSVAITGTILASVGLFLSTFSPNLDVMILLYGVVGGVGFGLMHGPAVIIISYYFEKRRAFATGIAVCGSGIGGFVFAPICRYLLGLYGWRGAMWILSAIVLNGVIFAAFYRPLESQDLERTESKDENAKQTWSLKSICGFLKEAFDCSMFRSPSLVVYMVSSFLVSIGFYIPFNFLPALTTDLNMSTNDGALLISIIGISNTLTRLLIGYISDQSWADSILINSAMLLIGGVTTCLVPYYSIFGVLAAYSTVFGSVIGTFVLLRSIILIELRGLNRLSNGFGLHCFITGLAVIAGAPIAGFLSDFTGDYDIAFYFAGTVIGFSGIVCFPLRKILEWEKRRAKISTESDVHISLTTDDRFL